MFGEPIRNDEENERATEALLVLMDTPNRSPEQDAISVELATRIEAYEERYAFPSRL